MGFLYVFPRVFNTHVNTLLLTSSKKYNLVKNVNYFIIN